MKTITQHQISILLALVSSEAHNPDRHASSDVLADIFEALTEASLASGPMVLVGEASYLELEACLDEATPRSGEQLKALDEALDGPVGYCLREDTTGTMAGPFADLRELRQTLRGLRLTAEMVEVGPWRRPLRLSNDPSPVSRHGVRATSS